MIGWATNEVVTVVLRFLLYTDLLLLAGLAVCGGRTAPVGASARLIAGLAAGGAVLTMAQFLSTALGMVGGDAAALDAEMLRFIALDTNMGLASVARTVLLVATALLASLSGVGGISAKMLAVAAVASLAWAGHAGANEGGLGLLHRTADIFHLLAAAIWIGTLALLLAACTRPSVSRKRLIAALRNFAKVGTLMVAILIVTGLVNLWAIAGFEAFFALPESNYGKVLLLKLFLFVVMLAFAALNRWRFVPILERDPRTTTKVLKRSMAIEICLALAILLAVALLGTLSPAD